MKSDSHKIRFIMIITIMGDMIRYFHHDVKRINHALKVYDFASLISKESKIDEHRSTVISITALLHDIGIKEAERKFNSSSGKLQEQEGPPIARQILQPYNLSIDVVDRVCYLIGNHHTYSKIDDSDFQILVEADFIVNIFEDSMSLESIAKIKNTIFKTKSGIRLLDCMYLQEGLPAQ